MGLRNTYTKRRLRCSAFPAAGISERMRVIAPTAAKKFRAADLMSKK